jgi:phage tail P2-like protein
VGVSLAETWPAERKRRVIAEAVARHRDRGTVRGLRSYVEALTDGDVEIEDSGGTTWSDDPDVDPPGGGAPRLHVVVRVDDPASVDQERLRADLREVRPVHVPVTLEVRGR